jgi:hypothetical protein
MTALSDDARDRLYARCAAATSDAGRLREPLFLARLTLLLFEEIGDESRCTRAIEGAMHDLPEPSLSAGTDDEY